MSIKN
jgi:Williams-Beuren syndrome DDT (WSD), D-TOX E motif